MRGARGVTAAVSAFCVVALVIAGCSKNGQKQSNQKAVQQQKKTRQAEKSLPGTQMIAASRDQVQQGGTLRIAVIDFPQNFDSYNVDGNDAALIPIDQTTLPQVFTFDNAGNPVLNKDYLSSAKVTSQKPFTVTFEVNPKAIWSDGTPIGFPDFYDAWKANNGSNPAFKTVSTNGWDQITGITKGSSNRDIKVSFKAPYSGWPSIFNGLFPASLTATPKAFNSAWQKFRPISGGPFIMTKADATAQAITEKPNPKWWGEKPKLSQIVVRTLDQPTQAAAFSNGELDALPIGTNADVLKQAENVPNTRILRSSGLTWYHIDLNGKSPLLSDAKLRTAIFQGIDRNQIAKTRLAPIGAPASLLSNHMYMPSQDGFQQNDSNVGYNPDQAKKTLDSLGWKMQGKYRQKNGKQLILRMVGQAGNPVHAQVGEQVQQSLAAIGVRVKLVNVPKDDYFTKYVYTGDYDLTYYGWTGGAYPECSQKSIFAAGGDQNHTYVSTPEIGKLFDQACSTLDPTARRKLGNELDKKLFQLASVVTIYTLPGVGAMKKNLVNYDEDTSAFQMPDWVNVGFRKS